MWLFNYSDSDADDLRRELLKLDSRLLLRFPTQYYKEELIAHIMGWQADAVEKQASQIAAESLNIGALNCTRVSGDLKAARSLVRVHDILSTLQEQR